LRKKLQALFESMAQSLPPEFHSELMGASRKSGKSPEQVLRTALELYRATLLQPDSKDRLRVFAAQYHAIITREAAERMTPEERSQRASVGGQALSEQWTDEQKRARSSLGGYAAAAKMTPEQRRLRALAAAEGRRRKHEERERAARTSSTVSSARSKKHNRS
jgi:hypothetical protein